jgi:alkanesulfonate monooxygenase SsuD/methylene tetrahydromethanopterin reductase-like flavin-dependent oxidoreductase (luciferase family)
MEHFMQLGFNPPPVSPGDGLAADPKTWKEHKDKWLAGVAQSKRRQEDVPVLVEHYAVVGSDADARQAAELWRFGPKAFKGYHNIPDPAAIQKQAEAELPLEKVMDGWAVGTDPQAHIKAIEDLFKRGATIVNVHSGQADQKRVIDFYRTEVLPKVRKTA